MFTKGKLGNNRTLRFDRNFCQKMNEYFVNLATFNVMKQVKIFYFSFMLESVLDEKDFKILVRDQNLKVLFI